MPSSAPAEQVVVKGGSPHPNSLGLSGNNPGEGKPGASLAENERQLAVQTCMPLQKADAEVLMPSALDLRGLGEYISLEQAQSQNRPSLIRSGKPGSAPVPLVSYGAGPRSAEAGIKPGGTPEGQAGPPGHEGVNAGPAVESVRGLAQLQPRREGLEISIQENGGAHVSFVNNLTYFR